MSGGLLAQVMYGWWPRHRCSQSASISSDPEMEGSLSHADAARFGQGVDTAFGDGLKQNIARWGYLMIGPRL